METQKLKALVTYLEAVQGHARRLAHASRQCEPPGVAGGTLYTAHVGAGGTLWWLVNCLGCCSPPRRAAREGHLAHLRFSVVALAWAAAGLAPTNAKSAPLEAMHIYWAIHAQSFGKAVCVGCSYRRTVLGTKQDWAVVGAYGVRTSAGPTQPRSSFRPARRHHTPLRRCAKSDQIRMRRLPTHARHS
jgi:hypothetical protein